MIIIRCSSLTGLYFELGPCSVNEDGTSTIWNEYSWNNNASVLFLDQVWIFIMFCLFLFIFSYIIKLLSHIAYKCWILLWRWCVKYTCCSQWCLCFPPNLFQRIPQIRKLGFPYCWWIVSNNLREFANKYS